MTENDKNSNRIWAVVPSAGVGARMSSERPKQYLSVAGKTVLEHTLSCLLAVDEIQGVQLCIAEDDEIWAELGFEHEKLFPITFGGAQRSDTVLAGLNAISDQADANDWVMVHDAARPCLSEALLRKLITTVEHHPVGGILAIPVADTIKKTHRSGSQTKIQATIDRRDLWLAQTPQMFRYSILKESLEYAVSKGLDITDEASAVEYAGHETLVVTGAPSNIKLTYPEDLDWLNYFLANQQA